MERSRLLRRGWIRSTEGDRLPMWVQRAGRTGGIHLALVIYGIGVQVLVLVLALR
jgi:hypothetical protein